MIGLTGYLGAGKTTVLNHLLARPGARVGVVVNDFGEINVDAGLVTGQIDEAASIAGGCVCCLPDAGGLDDALERLTQPRLRLDAVVVEASGAADPLSLARLIRFSGAERVRPGGLIDVVDALEHERTVETGALAPGRFRAASLVVINKLDRVAPSERADVVGRLSRRIREGGPVAHVVATTRGRIDPALVFDVARDDDPPDELPIAALARADRTDADPDRADADHDRGAGRSPAAHVHATAVTVRSRGPAHPTAIADLLEAPPDGVYRLKGYVTVAGRRPRRYVVNVVGRAVHVMRVTDGGSEDGLVAIGTRLDAERVQARLRAALAPATASTGVAEGLRRMERHRRLSE
ncbi:CobW family GTP-binding protein [Microbacterium marinilacus]|uniref:GTP-binding protein n=1 Tax=Microbacterium marinilacus TaxID=415209 RepID=A0ABP7BTI7_9MICO|nr:GTP-binding protein [Microbacterium marinilacus]